MKPEKSSMSPARGMSNAGIMYSIRSNPTHINRKKSSSQFKRISHGADKDFVDTLIYKLLLRWYLKIVVTNLIHLRLEKILFKTDLLE
jgi:hypothetical protein